MNLKRSFHRKALVTIVWIVMLGLLAACSAERPPVIPGYPATEWVSNAQMFSLMVPEGWQAQEIVPGAGVVLANTQVALERYQAGSPSEMGDQVLQVGFLPHALLQEKELAHLGFQFEASPDVFLQSLLPLFRFGDRPASDVVGAVSLVSVDEGLDAGMLAFTEQERAGLVLVFTAADGVYAFISAVGYPGEMASLQERMVAVAGTVSFGANQNALYSALNGG